jgi:hypothetical protein
VLDVTVPCPSCPGWIRFGDRACPSCRAKVPPELSAALDERLEASDEDYRDLKGHVRTASGVLLVLGAVYAVLGIVAWYAGTVGNVTPPTAEERVETWVSVISNLLVSGAFLGCFAWARRSPLPALAVATAFWITVQLAVIVGAGQSWFYAFLAGFGWYGIMKLGTLGLVGRGFWGAWKASRLRARMSKRDAEREQGVYR